MLYGPSEELPHRQNVRGTCASGRSESGAVRKPKAPFELGSCALPNSPKPSRAAARKTPPDKADCDLLQINRMFEGARGVPTETGENALAVVKTPVLEATRREE